MRHFITLLQCFLIKSSLLDCMYLFYSFPLHYFILFVFHTVGIFRSAIVHIHLHWIKILERDSRDKCPFWDRASLELYVWHLSRLIDKLNRRLHLDQCCIRRSFVLDINLNEEMLYVCIKIKIKITKNTLAFWHDTCNTRKDNILNIQQSNDPFSSGFVLCKQVFRTRALSLSSQIML